MVALQKQIIDIPLAVGIETKLDPKVVPSGFALSVENGTFEKPESLRHRPGLEYLTHETHTNITNISTYNDALTVIESGTLYQFRDADKTLQEKGQVSGVYATVNTVFKDIYGVQDASIQYLKGYKFYLWDDTSSVAATRGVSAIVIDSTTGSIVSPKIELQDTYSKSPTLLTDGENIFAYWEYYASTPQVIRCSKFDFSSLTWGTPFDVATDANGTNPRLVGYQMGSLLLLAYYTNSSTVKLGYITTTGGIGGPINGLPSQVTWSFAASQGLSIAGSNTGSPTTDKIYVWGHSSSSHNLTVRVYNLALTSATSYSIGDIGVTCDVLAAQIESDLTCVCLAEVAASDSYNRRLLKFTCDYAGTTTSVGTVIRSVSMVSRPFVLSSGTYCVVAHESSLQPTNFVIKISGSTATPVGRFNVWTSGGMNSSPSTPETVVTISDTRVLFVGTAQMDLISDSGQVYSPKEVQEASLDFGVIESTLFEAGSLHIPSGFLAMYDGKNIVEHGFHLFPENLSYTEASGSITGGTRQYAAVYEWYDGAGRLHRSSPSEALTVTHTGTKDITVTVPTLRLTQKENVSIAIYRTVDAGSVFYRVTSISDPLVSDKTADTVSFIDDNLDGDITGNEILYISSGQLENAPTNSAKVAVKFDKRVFLLNCEMDDEIQYSQSIIDGYGVEFPAEFRKTIRNGNGPVITGAVLDDKLIIFKDNHISFIAGTGPNAAGGGSDYSEPQDLPFDVGCISSRAICTFPGGILFKSKKGWYLLNRSLAVEYIGAPVEEFNNLTVTNVVVTETKNTIKVLHSDGQCLVYNYFSNKWGTFTNYESNAGALWGDTLVIARTNGDILKESDTTWLDIGSHQPLSVTTPWIKTAGIQGFQRVWRASILGDNKGNHKIRVQIGYNYESFFREDLLIDSVDAMGSTYFGESSYMGEATDFGAFSDSIEQFIIKPAIQNCQAIRFKIIGLNPDALDVEGPRFTVLSLEIGVIGGINRVPETKTMVRA